MLKTVNFNPLSLSYWRECHGRIGWLMAGLIILLLGGKSFDSRDSAAVISGEIGGAGYLRAIALAAVFCIIFFNLKNIRIPGRIPLVSLIVYAVVGVFSVLWSSAPVASLGKVLEVVAGILLVIMVVSLNSKLALQSFLNVLIGFIAIELFIVLFGFLAGLEGFSELGAGGFSEILGRRAVGPFVSSNSVGYLSVILISYLVGQKLQANARFSQGATFFLVVAVMTLIFSSSRTSLALLFVFVCLIIFRRSKLAFVLAGIVVLPIAALGSGFFWGFIQGETAESNLITLSGRTVLWEGAYEYFKESPFTGYGFGIGSRDFFYNWGLEGFDDAISTVHNGILEVLLGVGLFGFIPWLLAICCALVIWRREFLGGSGSYIAVVSSLPVLLACTVMSVGVGGAQGEMFMLFCLICSVPKNTDNKSEGVSR